MKATKKTSRHVCCQNGSAISKISKLYYMTPTLEYFVRTGEKNFRKYSAVYNNVLALGAVAVDNDMNYGFDQRLGPGCIKMSGRTIHFFSKNSASLKYFILGDMGDLVNSGNSYSSSIIE